jgi:hypothetical protein
MSFEASHHFDNGQENRTTVVVHNSRANRRMKEGETNVVDNKFWTDTYLLGCSINRPPHIFKIHRATKEALYDSFGGLEEENIKFKERIKELEEALMPLPLMASPLTIVTPTTTATKLKGSSSLLTSAKRYVERNIKKIMALITEAWEVLKNIISFGSRSHAFHEYLQDNLKNEEGFYLCVVIPFGKKVSDMTELRRREEDFPSPNRIKKLNAC